MAGVRRPKTEDRRPKTEDRRGKQESLSLSFPEIKIIQGFKSKIRGENNKND